jgi:RimJ/RimL family protein N-acetyltransferase
MTMAVGDEAVRGPRGTNDADGCPAPLSRVLWGIDWRASLPFQAGRLTVVQSSFAESRAFVAEQYQTIFEEEGAGPFATEVRSAKQRYYDLAGDFFAVRDEARTVGLLVCTPADWSSYYIRSAAMLPEYQGARIIQTFYTSVLFPTLQAAGVERIELDTSPANLAMMHIATRLKFNQTGTLLSERWGALVHFTKFLDDEQESVFLRQFCAGVKYQVRDRLESRGTSERNEQ